MKYLLEETTKYLFLFFIFFIISCGESEKINCDLGYKGPDCKKCDDGYQDNDSDGKCFPTCEKSGLECNDGEECSDITGKVKCILLLSCDGISCSNHGDCNIENNIIECNCDADYHAEGLKCVENILECTSIQHEESGVCVSNTKMVTCHENIVNNANNIISQVEITWSNGNWSLPSDCDFLCNRNYHKSQDGLSCVVLNDNPFHFTVIADPHLYLPPTKAKDENNILWDFRDNILPAIKENINTPDTTDIGNFLICTGDMDPFTRFREEVESSLGTNFRFYVAIGNHDVGKMNNGWDVHPEFNWSDANEIIQYNKTHLETRSTNLNWGPQNFASTALTNLSYEYNNVTYYSSYDDTEMGGRYTTYSFDEGNSHFIILDIYAFETDFNKRGLGSMNIELYNWLVEDLANTTKENIFVFGHEPVHHGKEYKENGVLIDYSRKTINKKYDETRVDIVPKKKFWELLQNNNVIAYICGHTHSYWVKRYDKDGNESESGVWEINLRKAQKNYGKIFVNGKSVILKDYQMTGSTFDTNHEIILKGE